MWQVRKLDLMGDRQAWALAKIHGSACLHVRLRGWIAGQASSLSVTKRENRSAEPATVSSTCDQPKTPSLRRGGDHACAATRVFINRGW